MSETLHSDEFCRIDNTDKTPVVINNGTCPDTGARLYDLHERRELLYNDEDILQKLTGCNRRRPEDSSPPHPTWLNLTEATTTPKRPNGIKGSTKLIRRVKCKCMKKMRPSKCSCPKCTTAHDAVQVLKKRRPEWRRAAEDERKRQYIERKSAEGLDNATIAQNLHNDPSIYQCQACNGACLKGSEYYDGPSSVSNLINTILCDKVHVPEMDLKIFDKNFVDTGRTDQYRIHSEKCCYGTHVGLVGRETVRKCGWDAKFADMPEQTHSETDEYTGEVTEHKMHVCPDEFNFKGKVIWSDFITVTRGSANEEGDDAEYGASEGVKTQREWLPVSGSVPEFFVHLRSVIEVFQYHQYETKLSHRSKKKEEQCFLYLPAISPEECPEEYKNVVREEVDFSSVLHASRAHDLTCHTPEQHQCEIHIATGNPKICTVDSIKAAHPRTARALEKKGIHRFLRAQNVVIYAFSKAKPSAAYDAVANEVILSVLKEGKLPDNCKCEAFIDKKRVPGGDRSSHPPLPDDPDGLSDVVSLEPLFEHVRRWRRWRDGCRGQYQGRNAFLAWQRMTAKHGFPFEDCRNPADHGKSRSDGQGHVAGANIANSFDDNYGDGTQNLVRHLAKKYPRPIRGQRAGPSGLYSPTHYLYIYIPEGAVEEMEKVVAADEGYDGSSKDHYYWSKENNRLHRRMRVCPCDPCLKLDFVNCLLKPGAREAGTTPLGSDVVVKPKRPEPEARVTRGVVKPLADFAPSLSAGQNVILRVHRSDRANNPDEPYFLARVLEKAKFLEVPGTYCAARFYKNDWIVKIRWYSLDSIECNGDRVYKLWGREGQYINCNSIVRNIPENKPVKLQRSGQKYTLSSDLDEYICRYGDINH